MKTIAKNTLLGVPIPNDSLETILEKIILFTKKPQGIFHIVSLNPEIFALTTENKEFKKVVVEAQMRIMDGTFALIAAQLEGIQAQHRIQGVDLMQELLKVASAGRLRVVLIGGAPEIAEKVAVCQSRAYPRLEIVGLQGIRDVRNPSKQEEDEIFAIVAATKPHLVFVAFGSPYQELWIDTHKKQFERSVVMGVGGAFDFLSGAIPRAPKFMRSLGLEWLFRLILQPWRIKRQATVFNFFAAVVKEHFKKR